MHLHICLTVQQTNLLQCKTSVYMCDAIRPLKSNFCLRKIVLCYLMAAKITAPKYLNARVNADPGVHCALSAQAAVGQTPACHLTTGLCMLGTSLLQPTSLPPDASSESLRLIPWAHPSSNAVVPGSVSTHASWTAAV